MIKLYDYQSRLVNEARKKLIDNKGVMIVSPAGSGKSVVIAEIARLTTINKKHVLFIVHRKELAQQIKESFEKQGVDMEFATIMTVGKVVNRLNKLPYPQLIITDETHHSRAATYQKIYNHYSNAYRLGFTASPWRMSGDGFSDIYSDMVEGPDVQWLIDNQKLAPFTYYSMNLAELEKLKKSSTGEYSNQSIDNAMEKVVFGDVVEHYQKLAKGRKTIVYAHSIKASERVAEAFNDSGIPAKHCDSKTPEKERAKIMNDFREGKIQVLSNVDLISEGFNVPDCSCVILLRPTASLVLHIQQSMRCMRYQPNKDAIIIDHVGNYQFHGMPNTPRKWTIKNRPKNKKNYDGPTLTTCEVCFCVIESGSKECPLCGAEIETQSGGGEGDLKEVDGQLEEINQYQFMVDYQKIELKRKYAKRNRDKLSTLGDFYFFARINGYHLGWIKHQVPGMDGLSYQQLHMYLKPYKEQYDKIFN